MPLTAQEAFDLYYEAVFRFAYRLTRSADAAEDITQDCFVAFLRAPGRFDEARGSLKTYLFAIARNLALKRFRDHRSELPLDVPMEATTPVFDIASAVERAVAALPEIEQEALILFEYEGCTLKEIAEITGVEAGAVKSRLHRARARLKESLAPHAKGGVHGTAGR